MSAIIRLAWSSLWSRRFTVVLTLLTITLSVALFLGVDRVRQDAREAFLRSSAGIDLIVGARAHPVQLLLYSVLGLGDATQNLSWESYEALAGQPGVAWTLPISLGDSYRGHRVVGTRASFFEHMRQGRNQSLAWSRGKPFSGVQEVVLGAAVAERFGHAVGDTLVLAHGTAAATPQQHDDRPFRITGILAPTGTAIDQALYVSLESIEAIHLNWRSGTRVGQAPGADEIDPARLQPRQITAVYVGLEQRLAVFALQRWAQQYRPEALTAILPGVALQQLWQLLGQAERVLDLAAAAIVATGLIGLLAVLLASLEARRRELAILRSVGAAPRHLLALLVSEALMLAILGAALGYALLQLGIVLAAPWMQANYGVILSPAWPGASDWQRLGWVIGAAGLIGLVPGGLAYRRSVADGIQLQH